MSILPQSDFKWVNVEISGGSVLIYEVSALDFYEYGDEVTQFMESKQDRRVSAAQLKLLEFSLVARSVRKTFPDFSYAELIEWVKQLSTSDADKLYLEASKFYKDREELEKKIQEDTQEESSP